MSRTDILADALSMIKNAINVGKDDVSVPFSRLISRTAEILKEQKYIDNFKEVELGGRKEIKIYLKYKGKKSAIRGLKRISKPGRRVYVDNRHIPRVLRGYGLAIISTSKGIVANSAAEELKVGGEVLCYVW